MWRRHCAEKGDDIRGVFLCEDGLPPSIVSLHADMRKLMVEASETTTGLTTHSFRCATDGLDEARGCSPAEMHAMG